MRYELATLQAHVGASAKVAQGVDSFVHAPEAKGKLAGCWITDIGTLHQVLVLRAFTGDAEMMAERARIHATRNPFDAGEAIAGMTFDAYAAFPWVEPLKPGKHGAVYEFRTYTIKHGGLDVISRNWQEAVPARVKLSPMAAFLYTVSGSPRITHIWPYADMAERTRVRGAATAAGIWPPKETGPNLIDMTSLIALPTAFSPLG